MKIIFLPNQNSVKKFIKECEGKHVQQIAYSSYHDALTQICFNCNVVRTSLDRFEIADKIKSKEAGA